MTENLIRVNTTDSSEAEILTRLPLSSGRSEGGRRYNEEFLQALLFRYPQSLPISRIDPAYDGIVPICRELKTQSGYIDALFVNPLGRIVLVEFKLWRNPEARREVIGQILDYAKDITSWSYEDLQREVSLRSDETGNVVFKMVQQQYHDLDEKEFVDNVNRNLRRGEILLLIIGDGIQEGVENIVAFVQRHSGLQFNLALVEAALYQDKDNRLIVHPRILARTEIVQRFVIEGTLGSVIPVDNGNTDNTVKKKEPTVLELENQRFWKTVIDGLTFWDPSIDKRSALCPDPCKDSTLYVQISNTSFNGWAMFFGAFINRSQQLMGCYLAVRKGQARELRIYESLSASFNDLRDDIGEDLEEWINPVGRPRIGFSKAVDISFLAGDGESETYRESVDWMRTRLNRLVSHLHPKIQSMLTDAK